MKKLLWDYMDVERGIPAKAIVSTSGNLNQIASFDIGCEKIGSNIVNNADFIPAFPVQAPLLLLFSYLLISGIFFRMLQQRKPPYFHSQYSFPQSVPIYLKLGRLIYYN